MFLISLAALVLLACDPPADAPEAPSEPATAEAPPTATEAPTAAEPAVAAEPAAAAEDSPPESPHPYDENADARAEIDAAVALSAQDHKRTLLMFGANWCEWCRRLDYVMKHDERVMTALEANYHVVHVSLGDRHSDTNAAIDQAYGHPMQHGLPVFVVLDSEGEAIHTQETGSLEEGDHHDPAKVLAFLEAQRDHAAN